MRRLAALLFLLPASAIADLSYTASPDPASKTLAVSLTLEAEKDHTELRIPAWCPGYYVIADYQKKISDVKAVDAAGKLLPLSHPDERGWKVAAPKGTTITLSYRVLGDDPGLGFFAVSIKPHTAYINGSAAFMFPVGRLQEPVKLRLNLPQGWDAATAMDSENGIFRAGDYDELIDHPIQVGNFERRKFTVEGIPFEAVFVSENESYRPNLDEEARQLALLSKPAIQMMGGAPFKRYVYLIHLAIGDFSGGLEHRASTILAIPNMGRLRLHELAAHEFFHAWNIKQIRPKALGPFDYTQKVRVKGLWLSEGVTEYYAHIHAYRSGLRNADEMVRGLSSQIEELQESKTRKVKTVEDASMEAWENGSFGTGDLSYYTKGSLAGLVFDAAIRSATYGKKSLDDVMRLLFERHRLPKPGFEDAGILVAINEVAGNDLSSLYRTVVQSTDEMPYDLLRQIGLRVVQAGEDTVELGYGLEKGVVASVSAELGRQGLRKGDRILRVQDAAYGPGCFHALSGKEAYRLLVNRGGQNLELNLRFLKSKAASPGLELDPFASPKAEELREGWLKLP